MANTPEKTVGIVPSYQPDYKLSEIVRSVSALDFLRGLVIVDDGSGDEYREIFAHCAQYPGVKIIHLEKNCGAGGATKAGLLYALRHYPESCGFITFDDDGQHHPEDIRKVAEAFVREPDKVVIGVRNFHDLSLSIPLRSRFGNRMTEILFHLFTGIALADTQSGLRCFPREMAKKIAQIRDNRYEFLLETLLQAADAGEFRQIPIRTIYTDGNQQSHFRPVADSCRIYARLFRFAASSLLRRVLDHRMFRFPNHTAEGKKRTGSAVIQDSDRTNSVSAPFPAQKTRSFPAKESSGQEKE